MGEMTAAEASGRAGPEDGKLPGKKAGLTEGAAPAAPQEGAPPTLSSAAAAAASDKEAGDGPRAATEEPMELDSSGWRRPTTSASSDCQKEAEPAARPPDTSRTPELSLEELSISSRQQQQLQAASGASAGPRAAPAPGGGGDPAGSRRPNRKRKLLEDVESGKTLLLDAYRVWQQGQKVMTYDLGRIEKIMSETYMLIKQVRLLHHCPALLHCLRSLVHHMKLEW